MLSLLVLTLVTATEARVVIVERSTLGVSPSAGAQLRERLKTALRKVALEAELSKDACADRACLMAVSKSKDAVVIGMTVVKSKKGLTVDLDAVDGDAVVLQQTFLLSSDRLEQSPEAQVFAHQLSGRLVKDRPVAEPTVKLEPKREVVETVFERAPAPSIAPKLIGGASAGVGVVSIGLLIVSAVVKGQLDSALKMDPVSSLTRVQAQQQADLANGLLVSGLVGLGLGLAGGATAIALP